MIASLQGNLQLQDGETLVVDVRGVGYAVNVSTSVLESISLKFQSMRTQHFGSTPNPAATAFSQNADETSGVPISLIVHTDVKENDISLWGFSSLLEKQVFLLLKKVSGVGSKTAMAIVSNIGPELLLRRIGSSDITGLTKIPGVGKKTAERIVVELREQVGGIAEGMSVAPRQRGVHLSPVEPVFEPSPVLDAELALEKLGFSADRARKAVYDAAEPYLSAGSIGTVSAGELVQQALGKL